MELAKKENLDFAGFPIVMLQITALSSKNKKSKLQADHKIFDLFKF